MSLTNEEEAGRLLEWASENSDKDAFFHGGGVQQDSFWKTKKHQDTCIMEYDFKTIPEFERLCDSVFEKEIDRKIQRVFSVAAFKHAVESETWQEDRGKGEDKLPEHIYVF